MSIRFYLFVFLLQFVLPLSGEIICYSGTLKTSITEKGKQTESTDQVHICFDSKNGKYVVRFQIKGDDENLQFDCDYLWDGEWGLRRHLNDQKGFLEDKKWRGFGALDHRAMCLFYAQDKIEGMVPSFAFIPLKENVQKAYQRIVKQKENPHEIEIKGVLGEIPYRCSMTTNKLGGQILEHSKKETIEVLEWAHKEHFIPKKSHYTCIEGDEQNPVLINRTTWELQKLEILPAKKARKNFSFDFEGIRELRINGHLVPVEVAKNLERKNKK